jgi:hypothetical protein
MGGISQQVVVFDPEAATSNHDHTENRGTSDSSIDASHIRREIAAVCEDVVTKLARAGDLVKPHHPRIQELLLSNSPPRGAENSEFIRRLQSSSAELAPLDDRLLDLQTEMTSVLLRRQHLKQEYDALKLIMHPVRQLPADILLEIFTITMNFHRYADVSYMSGFLPSIKSLIHLSHVCKEWRYTALTSPGLWSEIQIDLETTDAYPRTTSSQSSNRCALLEASIHRSAAHPLSVYLSALGHIPSHHPIFRILLPTSPRWRHLYLCMRVAQCEVFFRTEGHLQNLEVLHIDAYHVLDDMDRQLERAKTSIIQDIFRRTPKLKTVEDVLGVLQPSSFSAGQVTHFRSCVNADCDATTLALLTSMKNLTSLSLWSYSPPGLQTTPLPAITSQTLQNITSLDIGNGSELALHFLQSLVLPSLTHLSFTRNFTDDDLGCILSLIKRSHSHLISLKLRPLRHADFSDQTLLELLWSVPSIEEFCWCYPTTEGDSYSTAIPQPVLLLLILRPDIFLPKLRLCVDGDMGRSTSFLRVVQLQQARPHLTWKSKHYDFEGSQ